MKKIIFFLLIVVFFVLFEFKPILSLSQESPKKILILPFEIHAQQDLLYLKSAIPEMLTSRIFTPSKIEVIEFERVNPLLKEVKSLDKAKIQELGVYFKADYIIWGSLTVLGDTVSIDAQVLDLSQAKKPVQFYQEIKGLSEVIPQLSRFAKKAKSYIEGKEEDFYKEEVASFYPPFSLSRAHPERNLYSGNYPLYSGGIPSMAIPSQIQEQKPKVTRAKPRFSYDEDESLTKNLVIDLSKSQPVVGWAEEEKTSPTNASKPLTYTPPLSPQSYPYYYQTYSYPIQEEKGFLEKIWDSVWPFKKKEFQPSYLVSPQVPLPTSQTSKAQAQVPVPITPQPQPIYFPPSPSQSSVSGSSGENPWQWN